MTERRKPTDPAETDRRQDLTTRERVVQLEQHWREESVRLQRAARLLRAAVVVIALATAGGIATVLHLQAAQQRSRVRAIEVLCLARNADHAAIVGFVAGRNGKLAAPAASAFPQTPNCHSYAQSVASAPTAVAP